MKESWEDLLCRVYYAGYTDHQHGRYRDAKSAKVVHTAKIRADLLKQHINELESINADLYSALLSAEQSIVTFMGVHGYSNESGAGYILAEVKTALAKARGEKQPR